MGRIDDIHLDKCGGQQPLDFGHRGYQTLTLSLAQRIEKGAGQFVASPVEEIAFSRPCSCQLHRPDAPVVHVGIDGDQLGGLDRAQQTAR